ncbi:MAG: HAMP domain-containing protein [Opitutaceae bacterium]|nr:HAMP domain-containing protein [Opitutaceae bacterium]
MLRTRLLLGFILLLLLLSAVGAYAVWTTQELGRSVAAAVVANARGLIAAQQLKDEVNRLGSALRQVRAADTPGNRAEFETVRTACQVLVRDQLDTPDGGMERAARLEEINISLRRLADRATSASAASLRPLELMKADEAAVYSVLRTIDRLTEHDSGDLRLAEEKARRLTARTTAVFGAGVAVAVVLALIFAWGLGRALLQPIRQLTDSAQALGEGNLDRDVPVTSHDELGELARTFNAMAAKLRIYRDAMAEKAQRAQRVMEATLTSAPDPLFVVSREGTQEVRNPAAEVLAATPEFAAGFPEAIARPLQEVLATGTHYLPTDYQRVVTVRDRHYLPRILAIGVELADFRGAAVVLQDVTKFRLLDDAKSNLVGTVSHELKTPLTSLRMAVYLLLEQQTGQLTPVQHELVEQVRNDTDRLLRILNDLLDLSRIESGVAAPHLRPVAVAGLLEAMAREVRPLVEAAGQTLIVQCPAEPPRVQVDEDRIRHVFINLLTNASKYSPAGSAITLYAKSADEGFLRFGVLDNGPGIAEEHQSRVFERFFRIPGQTKKGAGLGLAICREIVVAHGGSIACASAPGRGCDFHFLLPADKPSTR